MLTERLGTEEAPAASLWIPGQYPMDSSRILLGLMALSRTAETSGGPTGGANSLEGVIHKGVLRSLLSALHFRDVATVRHCRRVAHLSVGIAQHLGWEDRNLTVLEVAALLHDIGKIGVPDNILLKPGKLNADEAELMALHHNIGIDILQAARADRQVLEIIAQAHTHYSSSGDGYRRVGSELHQGARILAVADAYDSLSTDQVYRQGKSHAEAVKTLCENAGTQFDGNVVRALSRWIDTTGLPFGKDGSEGLELLRSRETATPEEAFDANCLCHIFSYLYVLESLYDGFYLVDSDLRFVVWSRGIEKLLGRSAPEMLSRTWTSRQVGYYDIRGRELADSHCPMHHVVAQGRPVSAPLMVQREDGRKLMVEVQTVPLLDTNGHLQGVVEIFRDVTRSTRRPQEFRELKMAASRDALTSVANRGELESQLATLVCDFAKDGNAEPFSVIFLDVDHFKSVNDTHGHVVGDQVLIDLARLLQQETYSGELIGRYGGEEFVVLCPDTDLAQAVRRAERLRSTISRSKIGGIEDRTITSSFGVTQAEPGDSVESVLRRADRALYTAKETGRNRTCSLTSAEMLSGKDNDAAPSPPADPFVFTGEFRAVVAAEMVIYKLGGFVSDKRAKLVEVSEERAKLRVGTAGLFGFWGGSEGRQPVEVEVNFSRSRSSDQKGAAQRVQVAVRITPLGWIRDPELFQARAQRVLQDMRSYFAAD